MQQNQPDLQCQTNLLQMQIAMTGDTLEVQACTTVQQRQGQSRARENQQNVLLSNLSNIPISGANLLVCWHVVAYQSQDHHHHMLCHTDHIGPCIHKECSMIGKLVIRRTFAKSSCQMQQAAMTVHRHCQLASRSLLCSFLYSSAAFADAFVAGLTIVTSAAAGAAECNWHAHRKTERTCDFGHRDTILGC